ncbi:hypothetical protein [Spirosoma pulveris]
MKNRFIAVVAACFISASSFANSKVESNITNSKALLDSKKTEITSNQPEKAIYQTCTVTVKGTIDGKVYNLSVTFTADDCVAGYIKIIKGLK